MFMCRFLHLALNFELLSSQQTQHPLIKFGMPGLPPGFVEELLISESEDTVILLLEELALAMPVSSRKNIKVLGPLCLPQNSVLTANCEAQSSMGCNGRIPK